MVKDAERHAEEDQKRREAVEAKNMAENAIYQTEKLIKEQADRVAPDKKTHAESAIAELKEAIKSGDTDRIKSKVEALNSSIQAISADLYAKAKASGPRGAGGAAGDGGAEAGGGESGPKSTGGKGASKEEGEVIDADFEMVDDKDKK